MPRHLRTDILRTWNLLTRWELAHVIAAGGLEAIPMGLHQRTARVAAALEQIRHSNCAEQRIDPPAIEVTEKQQTATAA